MAIKSESAQIWGRYAWPEDGDEWKEPAISSGVPYPEWKQSVVDHFLTPRLASGTSVIEIGCGHGRWSTYLANSAASAVYLVDITLPCLDYCRARFGDRCKYLSPQPESLLKPVTGSSIDFIWSYDTFVHIDASDVAEYLREFHRVLKPQGVAIIHHPDHHGRYGGCRSDMTAGTFRDMAANAGVPVKWQFDSWGDRLQYNVRAHRDLLSAMVKV